MASTKTTKKTAKATEVKSLDQLRTDLAAKQADQIEAIRGHRLGELANPQILKSNRKQIARLLTAITQAEREAKQ